MALLNDWPKMFLSRYLQMIHYYSLLSMDITINKQATCSSLANNACLHMQAHFEENQYEANRADGR
jgi:hypothetical protein